jgi:hypothetical protein
MARQPSFRGGQVARRIARFARHDLERQRLFDAFVELGAPRVATRIAGRIAALPPIAALEQRLFDLWIAKITQELRASSSDPFELARALIKLTRSLTVTQRQTDLDVRDSFEDDDFTQRKMTILASGVCNCEMSNFIVWTALRELGHFACFFETGLRDEVSGSHLLLYVFGRQGAAFVDAWSDVPCFHLSGFIPELPRARARWLASRYGGQRPPGVPELSELAQLGLRTHGLYPADSIRDGSVRTPPNGDVHPPASAAMSCVSAAVHVPTEPVWSDYMALRRQHLVGQLDRPAQAYEQFAARTDLTKNLRVVVTALAKRLAQPVE